MLNKKYLMRQGEPEAQLIPKYLAGRTWDHFIAIPCCGEDELLPRTLESIARAEKGPTLVLLLVNEGPHTPEGYKASNRRTLNYLYKTFPILSNIDIPNMSLRRSESFDILLVERTDENLFPAKKGVGLARKICADIGLSLYQAGIVKTPWIHNTDGDAEIPPDYFTQALHQDQTCSALLHRYRHQASNKEGLTSHWSAAILYECWLRYYVLGLRYAQSPYAFPTIGSTITINAISYSQVQGFPKREAGEDFYLLNKLFKVGPVTTLRGRAIILQDRMSSRVPFGTGQGTQKIKDTLQNGENFLVYHPDCFRYLKLYLSSIKQSFETNGDWIIPQEVSEVSIDFISATTTAIKEALSRSRNQEQAFNQFSHWFDGFRTLKFIHAIRDRVFGSLSIHEALKSAPFWRQAPTRSDSDLLDQLRKEDEIL